MLDSFQFTDFASLPAKLDFVVIGSGAGGAVAATTLAESGNETVLLEEGGYYPQSQYTAYSLQEMMTAYRRSGMTVSLGKAPINYAEARCIGGGSEINSGLYHRPPQDAMQRWAEMGAIGADSQELIDICTENENDLNICLMPSVQPASQKLADGANALGWQHAQIPRWHQYDSSFAPNAPGGMRQSMSRTFLPRFIKAGGKIITHCEATQLEYDGDWKIKCLLNGNPVFIRCRHLIVAAGAVRTPQLLRSSGHKKNVGNHLRLHVFTRVLAEFDEPINHETTGIGPHQVDEFAPRLRFGCGVSSAAHCAAAIAQCGTSAAAWLEDHHEKWRYRASYYATIGSGRGWVRNIGNSEAVFYHLDNNDYYDLADGQRLLSKLLFQAGAKKILPIFKGSGGIDNEKHLWKLPRPLKPQQSCLSSVHLMGSCPMGGSGGNGVTDAYGAVHGTKNLWLADASVFCDSPNVNPQGTVMAFSRRNTRHLIANL